MADTQRTLAALVALLPDNTAGQISPQDVRDLVETIRQKVGALYASASGVVDILSTAVWYDAAATFALCGCSEDFDLQATGRLRYTGTSPRRVHAVASISYSTAGTNQVLHFRLALSGVGETNTEQQRLVAVNGDVGTTSVQGFFTMSNGDYMTLQVRNETSVSDVTFEQIHLLAVADVL